MFGSRPRASHAGFRGERSLGRAATNHPGLATSGRRRRGTSHFDAYSAAARDDDAAGLHHLGQLRGEAGFATRHSSASFRARPSDAVSASSVSLRAAHTQTGTACASQVRRGVEGSSAGFVRWQIAHGCVAACCLRWCSAVTQRPNSRPRPRWWRSLRQARPASVSTLR